MTPVVEIKGETRWGIGTLFGKFLLTAEHVIKEAQGSVLLNDKVLPLDGGYRVNTVSKEVEHSRLYDFAIFKSDSYFNDFDLLPEYPQIGEEVTFHPIRNGEHISIHGTVVEIIDYFIHCKFDSPVRLGECGSPISIGNHICGILNLGDGENESTDGYFQSSASIVGYLKEKHPDFLCSLGVAPTSPD